MFAKQISRVNTLTMEYLSYLINCFQASIHMQMTDTLIIISHSYLFIKACSLRTYIRYNLKSPFLNI